MSTKTQSPIDKFNLALERLTPGPWQRATRQGEGEGEGEGEPAAFNANGDDDDEPKPKDVVKGPHWHLGVPPAPERRPTGGKYTRDGLTFD